MSEINNNLDLEKQLAQTTESEKLEGAQDEPQNDPADSLRKNLACLYENYFQEIRNQLITGMINLEKADELVDQIDNLSRVDLGYEVSKVPYLESAREIMGPGKFFGPEEVEKAGIEIAEEIPQIPFSPEELKRAQELGQMLIYRTSISINEMDELVRTKLNPNGGEKFIDYRENLKIPPDFFSETIPSGWALVSDEIFSESRYQSIFEQTRSLIDYLTSQVFRGELMPEDYEIAISDFRSQEKTIDRFLRHGSLLRTRLQVDQLLCRIIRDLKINQFIRPTPAETIYDWLVCFQNTGKLLFHGKGIFTSTPVGEDGLATLWFFDPWRIQITDDYPGSMGYGGNVFSRRF